MTDVTAGSRAGAQAAPALEVRDLSLRIGGAQISPLHANIIVNRGSATARDVRELIALAQQAVEEQTGHRLEPEIGFVGEF